MEENHILAKWLNNEMTESELADFMATDDYVEYEKIKNYTAQLEVAGFDEKKVLENILKQKKTASKIIFVNKKWFFNVAAVLVLGLGITFLIKNYTTQSKIANNAETTAFVLPDDSQVILNSGSSLEYKKWNWKNKRFLNLKGEAYFRVAKGKKFQVNTNLGKVTVLGTQFDVKARDSRFDVICFEGRVKVDYKNQEVLLTKGHHVIFENNKKTVIVDNTITKPDWLSNQISFNKDKLSTITEEIQRQYNVTIDVTTIRTDKLFSGKIPSNNLDVALQIIASTYQLQIIRSNNKIILRSINDKK